VATKSGQVPANAAKQSSLRAAISISTTRPVNTASPKPKVNNVTTAWPKAVVSAAEGNGENAIKQTQDQGIFDSGCSRHMTGNKSFLTDYQEIDGGFIAFGGSPKGGKFTRKGKIKTGKLDFEHVYFVKELKFNLFFVSQMCDKKNSVLFTETECLVLSPNFKLLNESQVLLKVPRHDNVYCFDLKNVVPSGGLTCLFAKATIDESNLWHERLGHINFKTMKKLVRGNLVRGLPSKLFENDHTCVACEKGKQHKASCKTKLVNSISQPLQMLHMNLSEPTSVRSLNHKTYCLVVTDDFSRFSWVFFLATKNETSGILKTFITGIENQINHKVKIIRCDNGTDFKNNDMNQLCGMKGIKREFIKFDGKANEGFLVGYSINSKAFRDLRVELDKFLVQQKEGYANSTNRDFTVSPSVSTAGAYYDEDVGAEVDLNNLEITMNFSPIPTTRIHKDHPKKKIIGDPLLAPQTRRMTSLLKNMLWSVTSKSRGEPITRIIRMAYLPVYRNKKDKRGIVVRNKARLMAQGYTQEEGIYYNEMDVKSAFLYVTIEEEVYVCQPPGFEDPQFPNKVYKVEKALYGLHQAPRAWYETLSTYLLENGFRRGNIDKTLFIKKDKGDMLLVQMYVDDIIFGSIKKSLCVEFEQMMHKRFQMSSKGELTFFLGLQ
ncbi:putative ribonuclease H-like domain-containing protein, partial [Tanacetum coccineum]